MFWHHIITFYGVFITRSIGNGAPIFEFVLLQSKPLMFLLNLFKLLKYLNFTSIVSNTVGIIFCISFIFSNFVTQPKYIFPIIIKAFEYKDKNKQIVIDIRMSGIILFGLIMVRWFWTLKVIHMAKKMIQMYHEHD